MKRVVVCCIFGILAALISMSCSQKYEPPIGPTVDTVTVHDTIRDTLPPDTVKIIDTVYIKNPNDTSCQKCGTIEGSTKCLSWIVDRRNGTYAFTFTATTERDQPPQSVTVTVGEQQVIWDVVNEPTLILQVKLQGKTTVTITSNTPPARGHGITICLNIKRE